MAAPLIAKIGADYSAFNSGLKAVKGGISGLAAEFTTAGKIAAVGFAGVTAVLTNAAIVGGRFEKQMSSVKAVLRSTTDKEFAALEKKALDLGKATEKTATDVAAGIQSLGQMGFKTNEILSSVSDVLDMSTISGMDFGSSAERMANIIRGFGLEAKDASHILDVLTTAQSTSGTSISELTQAYRDAAPAAKIAGWSFEQTTAALALLGDVGIKGARGGVALKTMLGRLATEAENGMIKIRGQNIAIMDQGGKIRNLTAIVHDMSAAGLKADEMFKILGTRGVVPAKVLMEAQKKLNGELRTGARALHEQEKILRSSAGAGKEAAAIMRDNVYEAFGRIRSAIENVNIQLFKKFGPQLKTLMDANISPAIIKFGDWVQNSEELQTAFDDAFDTLKGGIDIIKELNAKEIWQDTIQFGKDVKAIWKDVAGFLGPIANAFKAVVGTTASIAGRLYGEYENQQTFRKGAEQAGQAWAEGLADKIKDPSSMSMWEKALMMGPGSLLMGKSPPPLGPLSTIDIGGKNVGKAWIDGLVLALNEGKELTSQASAGILGGLLGGMGAGGAEGTGAGESAMGGMGGGGGMGTFEQITASLSKEQAMWMELTNGFQENFKNGMMGMVDSVISGSQTMTQAIGGFAKTMVQELIKSFLKIQMQNLLTSMFGTKAKAAEAKAKVSSEAEAAYAAGVAWGTAAGGPALGRAMGLKAKALALLGHGGIAAAQKGIKGFMGGAGKGLGLGGVKIPGLAEGGIVTKPTLIMAGERTPERIQPLDGPRADVGGGGGEFHIHVHGGGPITEETAMKIAEALDHVVRNRDAQLTASRARLADEVEGAYNV